MTPHADGTVTVGINKSSGIPGANASLTALGDRVVVVPVRAGCESMDALPAPASKGGDITVSAGTLKSVKGSITVNAHGIPRGDLLVLAVVDTSHGISIDASLTSSPAPSCVSEPAAHPVFGGHFAVPRSDGTKPAVTGAPIAPQGTKQASTSPTAGPGPSLNASAG